MRWWEPAPPTPRFPNRRCGGRALPSEALEFGLADGGIIECDVGDARLRVNGEDSFMRVMFGDDGYESLLGSNALQEFLLLIDPVGERLIPRRGRA